MNWAIQTILYAGGLTLVFDLIIILIYKLSSRGRSEE